MQEAYEGNNKLLGSYQTQEGQRVLNSFNLETYPGDRNRSLELGIDAGKAILLTGIGMYGGKLLSKADDFVTGLKGVKLTPTEVKAVEGGGGNGARAVVNDAENVAAGNVGKNGSSVSGQEGNSSISNADISSRLPGPKLDPRTASTFDQGIYTNTKLTNDTTFYKYHGVDNRTGKKISWVTNKRYDSEQSLRQDLAIREDWGVKIEKVTEFNVPKGTWISEGRAASQGNGYPGGGYQAVIQNLPVSNIVRTDKAFD